MSSFSIGRQYTKEEKKLRAKLRKEQEEKKKKRKRQHGLPNISKNSYEPFFLRTWLLKDIQQNLLYIEPCLVLPYLSFKERYNQVEHFCENVSLLEESFWKGLKKNRLSKDELLYRYQENQKLRWAFKKLVLIWKSRRLVMMNDTDIITFEKPKQPILIYDFKSKKQYQLEARPLLIDSVNRLLLHNDFFPELKMPRNLLTNEELTWNQLWSISRQFQKYGVSHWIWEAFVRNQFYIPDFLYHFEIPLKYEMVERCFQDSAQRDANWYICDIITNYTHGILCSSLKWAVYRLPENTYIREWKNLCYRYWKLAIVNGEQAAEENPTIVSYISKLLEDRTSLLEIRKLYRKDGLVQIE